MHLLEIVMLRRCKIIFSLDINAVSKIDCRLLITYQRLYLLLITYYLLTYVIDCRLLIVLSFQIIVSTLWLVYFIFLLLLFSLLKLWSFFCSGIKISFSRLLYCFGNKIFLYSFFNDIGFTETSEIILSRNAADSLRMQQTADSRPFYIFSPVFHLSSTNTLAYRLKRSYYSKLNFLIIWQTVGSTGRILS